MLFSIIFELTTDQLGRLPAYLGRANQARCFHALALDSPALTSACGAAPG